MTDCPAMSQVGFYRYQGEIGPILLAYLEQVRTNGMRAYVKCPDGDRVQSLERELWKQHGTRFIGIGANSGALDADQPVLISTTDEPDNDPDCFIAIGSTPVDPGVLDPFSRVAIFFSTLIESESVHARTLWKALDSPNRIMRYYSQTGGSWTLEHTHNC